MGLSFITALQGGVEPLDGRVARPVLKCQSYVRRAGIEVGTRHASTRVGSPMWTCGR